MLFPEDSERISKHLHLSVDDFEAKYCRHLKMSTALGDLTITYLRHIDGACVFLNDDGLCTIHRDRPIQCQRTPFGFFWDGQRDFDCMKNVDVGNEWSTEADDDDLMNTLFRENVMVKTEASGR